MIDIKNLVSEYSIERSVAFSSERAEVVYQFVTRLNAQRKKDKYRPLPASFVAVKMSHLDLWDLKVFLGQCKEAKHFSKYWFWALKPQK